MARRWIRLDVDWDSSEWVYGLSDRAQLAWVKLCCYVKRSGVAGRVRALTPKVLAGQFQTTVRAVEEMLQAAQKDGAVQLVDGNWVLTNWRKYQPKDATAAQRKQRERAKKQPKKPAPHKKKVTVRHGESRDVTDGHGPSRRDTVARDMDIDGKASSGDEGDWRESESPGMETSSGAAAPAVRTNGRKPPPPPWTSTACEVWAARLGTPNGGRIGKALKPLVAKHGEAEVLRIWAFYVKHEDPQYANPQAFASKYLIWLGKQQKSGPGFIGYG